MLGILQFDRVPHDARHPGGTRGTGRALQQRRGYGGKPFQRVNLILSSQGLRRSPGHPSGRPGLLGCVLKPHTGAVTDDLGIREHSERADDFLSGICKNSFLSLPKSFLTHSTLSSGSRRGGLSWWMF